MENNKAVDLRLSRSIAKRSFFFSSEEFFNSPAPCMNYRERVTTRVSPSFDEYKKIVKILSEHVI